MGVEDVKGPLTDVEFRLLYHLEQSESTATEATDWLQGNGFPQVAMGTICNKLWELYTAGLLECRKRPVPTKNPYSKKELNAFKTTALGTLTVDNYCQRMCHAVKSRGGICHAPSL
jgi:hypothetical protein